LHSVGEQLGSASEKVSSCKAFCQNGTLRRYEQIGIGAEGPEQEFRTLFELMEGLLRELADEADAGADNLVAAMRCLAEADANAQERLTQLAHKFAEADTGSVGSHDLWPYVVEHQMTHYIKNLFGATG